MLSKISQSQKDKYCMIAHMNVTQSCLTLCDPIDCSPWNSLGQDTSVGSLSLLQGIALISSVSSVVQSWPTLCDPMNCSTPGLTVHHQLPEFTQTQVHPVGDAIQPSHSLSSPFPPAPNPSQHQAFPMSQLFA